MPTTSPQHQISSPPCLLRKRRSDSQGCYKKGLLTPWRTLFFSSQHHSQCYKVRYVLAWPYSHLSFQPPSPTPSTFNLTSPPSLPTTTPYWALSIATFRPGPISTVSTSKPCLPQTPPHLLQPPPHFNLQPHISSPPPLPSHYSLPPPLGTLSCCVLAWSNSFYRFKPLTYFNLQPSTSHLHHPFPPPNPPPQPLATTDPTNEAFGQRPVLRKALNSRRSLHKASF